VISWHVEITEQAEEDMEEIYQYIANSLQEPGIAWRQTERIRDKIANLSFMPERNPVIQEEPWKSREIRRVNVDNYDSSDLANRISIFCHSALPRFHRKYCIAIITYLAQRFHSVFHSFYKLVKTPVTVKHFF